jgi:hypothetical protein
MKAKSQAYRVSAHVKQEEIAVGTFQDLGAAVSVLRLLQRAYERDSAAYMFEIRDAGASRFHLPTALELRELGL